jgi:hypothetical protein
MVIRHQHVMEGRDAFIASALDRLIQTNESAPNGTQMARRQRKRKPAHGRETV